MLHQQRKTGCVHLSTPFSVDAGGQRRQVCNGIKRQHPLTQQWTPVSTQSPYIAILADVQLKDLLISDPQPQYSCCHPCYTCIAGGTTVGLGTRFKSCPSPSAGLTQNWQLASQVPGVASLECQSADQCSWGWEHWSADWWYWPHIQFKMWWEPTTNVITHFL